MDSNRDQPGASTRRCRPRRLPWLALLAVMASVASRAVGPATAQTTTGAAIDAASAASAANAGEPTDTAQGAEPDPLAALRAEIADLRRGYEAQIASLEARLAALEAAGQAAPAPATQSPTSTPEADDLAALRAAAREAAGTAPGTATAAAAGAPSEAAGAQATFGRGDLNRLNPEIPFTGDFVALGTFGTGADGGNARDEFRAREFELDFQSALDPYSHTRWTLAFGPEGEVEVEEGYVTYNALPGGLGLNLGRFRQQFGVLNRLHAHALPQSDYPLALRSYFGDEGLAQTGLSARWLLPLAAGRRAAANELIVEVTDGESAAFGGEDFRDFAALVHFKNYRDLSDAAYFEWGLSGIAGKSDNRRGRQIWGTDLTFHWQPPSRAKYREFTWRTEVLLSDLTQPGGAVTRAWGGYTYGEGLIAQNLYAGARFDWVEDPLDPGHRTWGLVPYLTWWQSEYVRLRGEFRHFEDQRTARSNDSFLLQLTWAAGPHKHETY